MTDPAHPAPPAPHRARSIGLASSGENSEEPDSPTRRSGTDEGSESYRDGNEGQDLATGDDSDGPRKRKRRMKFSRSRGGCLTCRKQKKKCDQERPVCQRCKVAFRKCQYALDTEQDDAAQGSDSPSILLPSNTTIHGPPTALATAPVELGTPSTGITTTHNNLDLFSSIFLEQTGWNSTASTQQQLPTPAHSSLPSLTDPSGTTIESSFADLFSNSCSNPTWPTPTHQVDQNRAISHADPGLNAFDPNFQIDIALLRAFTGADTSMIIPSVIPIPSDSSNTQGINSTSPNTFGDPLPSAALLSVPLDCDSTLWSSFVDSSLWSSRPVNNGEDGRLMEYFRRIAATTVVIRNVPNSASQFYSDLASSASIDGQSALTHGVLCVSAQHLANWSRKAGDISQAITFADQATKHKSKALHLLRVSTAGNPNKNDASSPAVMVMLILGAILKGESDILPSFLQRTRTLLSKVDRPSEQPFLPTVSAIHSLYSGFHLLARGRQVDPLSLFPSWDSRPVWQGQAEAVCELIAGVKKTMFLTLLRAHSLVVELETITTAQERNMNDDELAFMRMELESEASIMKTELLDNGLFEEKYKRGCSDRTVLGHEIYRTAVAVLITKGVFDLDSGHPRLTRCVADMLRLTELCMPGLEIGLVWPFIIIASEADESQRSACSQFIERCQWKGSAGPRIAANVVEEVWRARDEGNEKSWKDVIVALGSPLVV